MVNYVNWLHGVDIFLCYWWHMKYQTPALKAYMRFFGYTHTHYSLLRCLKKWLVGRSYCTQKIRAESLSASHISAYWNQLLSLQAAGEGSGAEQRGGGSLVTWGADGGLSGRCAGWMSEPKTFFVAFLHFINRPMCAACTDIDLPHTHIHTHM